MPRLDVRGVSVRFGGNMALDDASLSADEGRVTGLIGPNGAGKTTLFNVVTGLLPPTSGTVAIDGTDITRLNPYKRARRGLARLVPRRIIGHRLLNHAGSMRNRSATRCWQ